MIKCKTCFKYIRNGGKCQLLKHNCKQWADKVDEKHNFVIEPHNESYYTSNSDRRLNSKRR